MSTLSSPPPPAPWTIGTDMVAATMTGGQVLDANGVYLYAFEIAAPITVSKMQYSTESVATGTVDMGLYDANGNLLGHTGAIANTSADSIMTNALTANLTLAPGRYFAAFCSLNHTDTIDGLASYFQLAVSHRYRRGVTAATAGVLPATTGGTNVTSITPFPNFCLIQAGGFQ